LQAPNIQDVSKPVPEKVPTLFIVPYAMSDSVSSFATVSLDELLAAME
jgi:hypothetical protein